MVSEWVLFTYRLPREPSTPRISLWRKLRGLGAAQLLDGLVALPADARTRERIDWLADEVIEAGGEASVWLGRPGSAGEEKTLRERMAALVTAEYQQVIDAAGAAPADPQLRRRTLARLRRELHRIGQRDYFPPPQRDEAHRVVATLAATVGVTA